ncbi:MAG: hypothetical protein FJ384_07790 [Verrucomicrobia bacterium]|nr:hypothetical protein [Verrucomicrobiota bacterium]
MRLFLAASLLLSSLAGAASDPTPYPTTPSPKGLQVQMVDDLLTLGVHHAGINLTLNGLLSPAPQAKPGQLTATADGLTFALNEKYVQSLDRQIKALSDKGVVVTAILITYRSPNERIRALTVHPQADPVKGTTMAANTVTPEGRACYAALTDFIARRWCSADTSHGRLWGWVISNEVNSHHEWHQMGPATVAQVAAQYEEQVRLAWTSLRRHSAHARVYLSLEHHWNSQGHADPSQACAGRALLEAFARRAKERGDFDWHLAYHPYPSNLRDPRTWLDKVTFDDDSKKVTFKNLEVVARKLASPAFRFDGRPRRLSLTEQGFDVTKRPEALAEQAAAYAYAWEKIRRLDGAVDAFLYHRQVDHALEGGLRFGLWSNKPGSIADPDQKRPIWHLLKAADTPDWKAAAEPYLKTCGLKSWDELNPK